MSEQKTESIVIAVKGCMSCPFVSITHADFGGDLLGFCGHPDGPQGREGTVEEWNHEYEVLDGCPIEPKFEVTLTHVTREGE